MTISYNGRSSRARKALADLFSTGLFYIEDKPNKETIAAINEAKKAEHLPRVDTSSVDAFIKSLCNDLTT